MRCPKCGLLMDCIGEYKTGTEWGCVECGFSATSIVTGRNIGKKNNENDYDIGNLNRLQGYIMNYVDDWASQKKTPIPLAQIKKNMEAMGIKYYTTLNAIKGLLEKGYIRKAVTSTNRTYYVQLRRT